MLCCIMRIPPIVFSLLLGFLVSLCLPLLLSRIYDFLYYDGFMKKNSESWAYSRPTVFESFGLSGETAILRASGIINIIQLLASMPVIFTLDLLGRRPLLLFGSVFPPLSPLVFLSRK